MQPVIAFAVGQDFVKIFLEGNRISIVLCFCLIERKCQDESNCDFFHETEITNSFRNLAEPFTTFNSSDYHAISPLGKSGVRVSEICLGTMTFGKEWGWGADEKTAERSLMHIWNQAEILLIPPTAIQREQASNFWEN